MTMAVIRLILLVTVLGALTLLLVQNWSPVIPLVFLGMRSRPLPLAMWILFITTAGAMTSLLITGLFQLSSYLVGQQRQTPLKSSGNSSRTTNRIPREEPTFQKQAPPTGVSEAQSRASDTPDDWETDGTSNEDWDFNEKPNVASTRDQQNTQVQDSKTYERPKQPTSGSQSGSVYSYSYQEPKNSGVGKTESVYDADYRVIIPPHQPSATKEADDDDWGFFDDDDSENNDKQPRK